MEKKSNLNLTKIIVLFVLSVITIVIFILSGYIYGYSSVFYNNVSDNPFIDTLYQKIPSLLKTIQIFTISWLVMICSRWLLTKLLSRTKRGTTIVKLINSFIKYLIAIIAVLLILSAWGVDTKTLIASAGILSLIIGLGAQSLISDIIAGVFIVFEGEFQVGDIVIIGGWRGTVDEIGIRTTKIIDWQGNIKIINNSEISDVINQTKELSVTTCVVSVDYRESIANVELVIKNNMERIKKAIPEIVEGPFYKGVDSLGESGVDLLFIATVKESDFYAVRRALNREIKIIFDENGISIPFPQVTVNNPDDFSGRPNSSDLKKADRFAKEQSDASKFMEDVNK